MASNPKDLRGRMASGIGWKVASQAISQGSRLAVGLLLARLLAPADFGLASLALTVVTGLQVLGDVGLGAALIQRDELTEGERSTAFWCTMVLAIALGLVMVLIATPVAESSPRLPKTIVQMFTAVPRSCAIPAALR